MVSGYLFAPGEPIRALESAEAQSWLASAPANRARQFLWLHFSLTHVNAEKWLRTHLDLPDQFFDAIHDGNAATRLELAGDSLVAVINDVAYEFSHETAQTATLWMCVRHDLVISARTHPLRSVDRLRLSVRDGDAIACPLALLTRLLREQADVLSQIVRTSKTQVDSIEDSLLSGRAELKQGTLGSLRRVFVRIRRLLAPEPAAVFRLLSRPPAWFGHEDSSELRATTEEFSEVLNDLAALQERTKLLQEEITARTAEHTGRSVYVLTMVTVLALPVNMIAGVLGMNVGGLPFAESPLGFWIVTLFALAVSGGLAWYLVRRQRLLFPDPS